MVTKPFEARASPSTLVVKVFNGGKSICLESVRSPEEDIRSCLGARKSFYPGLVVSVFFALKKPM